MCTYAHMHICTYAHMHICTYAHMHMCAYAYMHMRACVIEFICACAYAPYRFAYMRARIISYGTPRAVRVMYIAMLRITVYTGVCKCEH